MARGRGKDKGSIILRREEVVEGGHHGGAWKVAYADFVTAMMAFFLLMWLLNATTEEQRKGLADYFSPKNPISRGSSGTGAPFGGSTPYDHGSLTSDRGAVSALEGHAPPEDEPEAQTDTPTEVRPRNEAESHDDRAGRRQSGPPRALPRRPSSPMAAPRPRRRRIRASRRPRRSSAPCSRPPRRRAARPPSNVSARRSSRRPSRSARRFAPIRSSPTSRASSRSTSRRTGCASRSWTRTSSRCSPPAPPR